MRLTPLRLTPLRAALGALALVGTSACTAHPYTDAGLTVEADVDEGRALLWEYGCTSCHQVPGIEVPQGEVGPPLGTFAERRTVGGQLPHTPENAVRWIVDPREVDPATIMPDLGVSEDEAEAILAYLYSLD